MRQERETFAEYEATVALITVSQPEVTAEYCEEHRLSEDFVCLSDPEKAAYQAYGLSRGSSGELFSPKVFARGFQAALHGHFVGTPKGDPFQMPGVFIVGQDGILRYAHHSKDASDNPSNAELFAMLSGIV